MPKEARMDIRIPAELKEQIGNEADRLDRSKAWVIIAALRAYLSHPKPTK